jgi:RsmE family RNA methyltransferase
MNIVLFTEPELVEGIVANDQRVCHVRDVLSISDGDPFDAGVINGVRGKAAFQAGVGDRVKILFKPTEPASPLYPVDVMIGMSRPQSCRFVLRSLATLGVRSIEFVLTEKGERSYATSQLWTSGEYLGIVTAAVAQAFETNLPAVKFDRTLADALESLGPIDAGEEIAGARSARICLDNYESTTSLVSAIAAPLPGKPLPVEIMPAERLTTECLLGETASKGMTEICDRPPTCLLIGSERGWSDDERREIRERGFVMASMGPRVLRVETASVAAVATLLANCFWDREAGTASTRG